MINKIMRLNDCRVTNISITTEIIPKRSSNQNQTFKASISAVSNSSPNTFMTRIEHKIPAVEMAQVKRKYKYPTDKNNEDHENQ